MKKKTIIYGCITLIWIVLCTFLYCHCLIDLVGVVVSFAFAFPTIVYELISIFLSEKRANKLNSIKELQHIVQSIENKMIDGSTIKVDEDEVKKHIQIVCGKKNADESLALLKKDIGKFSDILYEKLKEMKPNETETKIYDLYS